METYIKSFWTLAVIVVTVKAAAAAYAISLGLLAFEVDKPTFAAGFIALLVGCLTPVVMQLIKENNKK